MHYKVVQYSLKKKIAHKNDTNEEHKAHICHSIKRNCYYRKLDSFLRYVKSTILQQEYRSGRVISFLAKDDFGLFHTGLAKL